VLLFETLTGEPPYPADTWEDLVRALEDPEVPRLVGVPGLPPAVADICFRCLARNPRDRPTARQVGEVLRDQLLPADPQAATMLSPTVTLPTVQTPPPSPEVKLPAEAAPEWTPAHRPPGRSRRTRVAVAVAASAVALTAAVFLGMTLSDPEAPPTGAAHTTAAAAPTTTATAPTATSSPTVAAPPIAPPASAPATTSPPPRPPSVVEVIAEIDRLIEQGVAEGAIRKDAGQDLDNLVRNLKSRLSTGSTDLRGPVADLRSKVAQRVAEKSIDTAYGDALDASLARLAEAA
jgi:serine/threonine-protein kinase